MENSALLLVNEGLRIVPTSDIPLEGIASLGNSVRTRSLHEGEMQGSIATVWQPKSLRQWLWTAAGASALFTTLMAGYYVADPGDCGSFWSMVAEAAQKFPLILVISALVTVNENKMVKLVEG
jgi:hypothetical protein